MRSLKVVLWLSWRSLFRRGVRFTTWVCVFAVGLMSFLPLEVYGILFGLKAVQQRLITEDPRAICLWVGRPGWNETLTTPEGADLLAECLRRDPQMRDWIEGSQTFHWVQLHWKLLDRGEEGTMDFNGRTFYPGDKSVPQAERAREGVYVSQRMLDALGWRETDLPKELKLEAPNFDEVSVPVLGLDNDLPWQLDFAIYGPWYEKFVQDHQDIRCRIVITGPVPGNWPNPRELPALVKQAISKYELGLPRAMGDRWRIESRGSSLSMRTWTLYLKQIENLMAQEGFPNDEGDRFWRDLEPGELPQGVQMLPPKTLGVVFGRSVEYLRRIKERLERCGLFVRDTNDTIRRLEHVHRSNAIRMQFVTGLLILIVAGLMLAVIALQTLRMQGKRREIGFLKATGMPTHSVRLLFLVESLIIWVLGYGVALGLALPIGKVLSPRLVPEGERFPELAFSLNIPMALLVGGAVILCSVALVLGPAHKAISAPPLSTLQGP